jgi:hypothetical protein
MKAANSEGNVSFIFGWYTVQVNLSKPSGNFTYHQEKYSKILGSAHAAFMCFVWMSEQTAPFALYSIS